jgi:PAS domain S-box-containing protein
LPGGVFIIDPRSFLVLDCNQNFKSLLGYDDNEVNGLSIFDIYQNIELCHNDISKMKNQSLCEIKSIKFCKKTGEAIEVDLNFSWIYQDHESFWLVHIEDVTERNKYQRISNQYRKLFEHSHETIMFIDKNGAIFDINRQAQKSYGYSQEEFLKISFYDLLLKDELILNKISFILENMEGMTFECDSLCKNGRTFPSEVSIKGQKIDEEDYFLVIIRDLSERKKSE